MTFEELQRSSSATISPQRRDCQAKEWRLATPGQVVFPRGQTFPSEQQQSLNKSINVLSLAINKWQSDSRLFNQPHLKGGRPQCIFTENPSMISRITLHQSYYSGRQFVENCRMRTSRQSFASFSHAGCISPPRRRIIPPRRTVTATTVGPLATRWLTDQLLIGLLVRIV